MEEKVEKIALTFEEDRICRKPFLERATPCCPTFFSIAFGYINCKKRGEERRATSGRWGGEVRSRDVVEREALRRRGYPKTPERG